MHLQIQSHCRTAITVALLVGLSGCSSIPKDGPTGQEVRSAAEVLVTDQGRLGYALVSLSPLVVSILETEHQAEARFSRLLRNRQAADGRVGPSDTLSISVFESGAGGLFIPADAGSRPGNFVQIPAQQPDRDGNITIPFGGSVHAIGRTPREIGKDIEDRLKERAIEPQVVVTIGERSANAVSVLGDVATPSLIPLAPGGLRLLAALARSGGPRSAAYDTFITV